MKNNKFDLDELLYGIDKLVFDIDFTMLIPHFKEEDEFFKSILKEEDAIRFEKERKDLIYEYERSNRKYDIDTFSDWLILHGFNITPKMIIEWIHFCGDVMGSDIPDGVREFIEIAKYRDIKQGVSTNWWWYSQVNRLKRHDLRDYFGTIITGDIILKPRRESYILAIGDTPPERCLMIGDDREKDYEGPISLGLKAIWINEECSFRDLIGGKTDDRGSKTKVRKRFE